MRNLWVARRGKVMRTACGLLLAGLLLAAARAADPPGPLPISPDAKKLRAERESLAKEKEAADPPSDAAATGERAVLRAKLLELVEKLDKKKMPPAAGHGPTTKVPMPSPRPQIDLPPGTKPVDGIRMAQNYYRADEIDAALTAFRLIDVNDPKLPREDKAFVQYMTACCLRRLGKLSEAAVIYREVADAKQDEFLAECAVWQLQTLRSTQELEAQLEQLRARRKGK